jgi:hypothetical protein
MPSLSVMLPLSNAIEAVDSWRPLWIYVKFVDIDETDFQLHHPHLVLNSFSPLSSKHAATLRYVSSSFILCGLMAIGPTACSQAS